MNQAIHNKIVSFIWGIADDVLRDLFKRGKYPDVILPMCVKGMRRRTAKQGPHAGQAFWGCSGYPECRGTRQIANSSDESDLSGPSDKGTGL
jgi:ssDNA-binding Zn-finger/Zn-ribbon topoisomerase 1